MKLQVASRLAIFALLELAGRRDRQVSVAEIGEQDLWQRARLGILQCLDAGTTGERFCNHVAICRAIARAEP